MWEAMWDRARLVGSAWCVAHLALGCSGSDADEPVQVCETAGDCPGASVVSTPGDGEPEGRMPVAGSEAPAGVADSDDGPPEMPPGEDGPLEVGEDGPPTVTDGPGAVVTEPDDESAPFWDPNELRTYEIEVAPEDLALIDGDPAAEQYVPASLTYEGEHYPNVGLRYKGSIGAFIGCTTGGFGAMGFSGGAKTCPKLSMKVSFNWAEPGGRFHGLKKLQFHSMNSDDSMMRDRLAYGLFREMGIAAPRAVHARLVINGELEGLFVLIEQIDSRFTRAHFTDGGDGNVYKEIWPKWTDPGAYLPPALKTNEDDVDVSTERVARFAAELEAAPDPAAVAALSASWMDNDYVTRFIAVDRAIQHDDGMFHWYCGTGFEIGNNPDTCSNHNFYMYEGDHWDQLWLIPWDLDLTLGNAPAMVIIQQPWNQLSPECDSEQAFPGFGTMAPSCDKLTRGWAELGDAYQAALAELVAGPMSVETINAKLDAWTAQIAPVVEEAAAAGQGPQPAQWEQALGGLRSWIDQRRTTIHNGGL